MAVTSHRISADRLSYYSQFATMVSIADSCSWLYHSRYQLACVGCLRRLQFLTIATKLHFRGTTLHAVCPVHSEESARCFLALQIGPSLSRRTWIGFARQWITVFSFPHLAPHFSLPPLQKKQILFLALYRALFHLSFSHPSCLCAHLSLLPHSPLLHPASVSWPRHLALSQH